MLGDGMVSFGVAVAVTASARNVKCVAEDRCPAGAIRSCTRSAADSKSSSPCVVAEVHLELLVGRVDAAELVDEVHVPRRTAELAVGGRLQTDLLLHRDDVADRRVLDRPQLVGVIWPAACCSRAASSARRAQQAADVVGAERRRVKSVTVSPLWDEPGVSWHARACRV